MSSIDPALVEALRSRVPLSPSVFDDRDDELSQLRWVADVGRRKLYVFPNASVAWGHLLDGKISRFDIVTGKAGADAYYEYVTQLPPEFAQSILSALRPGRDAGEALREVFGDRLTGLSDVRTRTNEAGEEHVIRVHHGRPYRRGVLVLDVGHDGCIRESRLLTGRAARHAVTDS